MPKLMARQIPMSFGLSEAMTFDSFYSGAETVLIDTLNQLAAGHGEQQVFIHGARGTGKTHLLTACCNKAVTQGQRVAYLPAEMILDQNTVSGFEQLDLVCIDDVQKLDTAGESGLFLLYNELRQYGGRLVISSDRALSELNMELADLHSRLSWGPVFYIPKLNDEQILSAFSKRASLLGLKLQDDVIDFIFLRHCRDLGSLVTSLDKLLEEAIVSKRRITIPFVKEVLGL